MSITKILERALTTTPSSDQLPPNIDRHRFWSRSVCLRQTDICQKSSIRVQGIQHVNLSKREAKFFYEKQLASPFCCRKSWLQHWSTLASHLQKNHMSGLLLFFFNISDFFIQSVGQFSPIQIRVWLNIYIFFKFNFSRFRITFVVICLTYWKTFFKRLSNHDNYYLTGMQFLNHVYTHT